MRAGLAPIVGAFAAGLVLEDAHFESHVERGERPLHESLETLTQLLIRAVFMVVATTMATPPLLLWSMRRNPPGSAPLVA